MIKSGGIGSVLGKNARMIKMGNHLLSHGISVSLSTLLNLKLQPIQLQRRGVHCIVGDQTAKPITLHRLVIEPCWSKSLKLPPTNSSLSPLILFDYKKSATPSQSDSKAASKRTEQRPLLSKMMLLSYQSSDKETLCWSVGEQQVSLQNAENMRHFPYYW